SQLKIHSPDWRGDFGRSHHGTRTVQTERCQADLPVGLSRISNRWWAFAHWEKNCCGAGNGAWQSRWAHSSVEKAGLIALVKMKFLPKALEEDRNQGLVPVFVSAAEGLWLHIDAAYAGTAFLCPEFRLFLNGIEYADSFTFNPSKWMMVHFDCTELTYKLQGDSLKLFFQLVDVLFCSQHWQIPLSRRFRSLKLWFVIRSFGRSPGVSPPPSPRRCSIRFSTCPLMGRGLFSEKTDSRLQTLSDSRII
uniref:Histidine decarboxylase n=1 Tax=Chelydra serpentina TaxID=8475 RepID=A0A8C3XLR9_CHESE